uniref:Monocarboxylate transporter n=1 Tax=Romanomermis culicivorax TaxID=13658 RepID=A0A915HY52_ROMCU
MAAWVVSLLSGCYLLVGVGLGFIYLPSIVIVSYYFEKKRALATGIAVCGSGIGTFIFAPLIELLLEHFSWQQTMLILSGIILQCILFAAVYKALTPTKQQVAKVNEKLHEYEEEQERKMTDKASDSPKLVNGKGADNNFATNLSNKQAAIERFNNAIGEVHNDLRQRNLSVGQRAFRSTMDLSLYRKQTFPVQAPASELLKPLTGGGGEGDTDLYNEISKRSVAVFNRPLSRMDIFYAGSVRNLPQFKSHQDVRHFIASTLSIPAAMAAEETVPGASLEPESTKKGVQNTLRSVLDFSLFSSPTFIILALSGFFTLTGFFVPFIYLPKMAMSFGIAKGKATFLVSVLGMTNIVARIFCGWLSDQPCANPLMINNVALIAAGVATAFAPHFESYALLCGYCVIFGTGTACFASLRSIICVQLLGLEKLTNAFGLLLLFMGIASLIGSPLAGFLFDLTKDFELSFYVMGSLVAFSGVLGLPLAKINQWEKRRQKELDSLESSGEENIRLNGMSGDGKPPSIVVHGPITSSYTHIPETVREEDEDNSNYNTRT